MDTQKATVLAGYVARTNMGHSRNIRKLRGARFSDNLEHWNLNTSVEHFCAEFMESNDHYDTFMGEAIGWFRTFDVLTDEQFAEEWGHIKDDWDNADRHRFRKALEIDKGASNATAIAGVLHFATLECNDEWAAAQKDPAVRLIVHQLAHITDIGASIDLTEYCKIVKACEELAGVEREKA